MYFPDLANHINFLQERSDKLSRAFDEWQHGGYESLSVPSENTKIQTLSKQPNAILNQASGISMVSI